MGRVRYLANLNDETSMENPSAIHRIDDRGNVHTFSYLEQYWVEDRAHEQIMLEGDGINMYDISEEEANEIINNWQNTKEEKNS